MVAQVYLHQERPDQSGRGGCSSGRGGEAGGGCNRGRGPGRVAGRARGQDKSQQQLQEEVAPPFSEGGAPPSRPGDVACVLALEGVGRLRLARAEVQALALHTPRREAPRASFPAHPPVRGQNQDNWQFRFVIKKVFRGVPGY